MERYCTFAEKLYIGEGVKDAERIKWKLQHAAGTLSVYLLAEAPENRAELAVIHAGFLTQDYYKTHPLKVYGIAKGAQEAKELLVRISDEAARAGMTGALKAYLDTREGGSAEGLPGSVEEERVEGQSGAMDGACLNGQSGERENGEV